MNEISLLCEKLGADVDMVRRGIGSDSRIGKRFLFPGVGYGGSCFPKDVSALYKTSEANQYHFQILDAVMQVNEKQKEVLVDKILSFYGPSLSGKIFAIWGLAFKPNTDDIREAPSLTIISKLLEHGATIRAFDPEAMEQVRKYANLPITLSAGPYQALEGADALLIITEWNEFRNPDFEKIKRSMKSPVIFDGRNVFEVEQMAGIGFYYNSIGRQTVDARVKA